MALGDIWRRLFHPELFDPEDPDAAIDPLSRHRAELAAELEALDMWNLPVVVAARQLVADTSATMPMVAVDDVGRPIAGPQPSVLRRPDPAEPYRRTIERLTNGMTHDGRSWLHVDAIGSNRWPLAVHVVDDGRVSAQTDVNGRITSTAVDGVDIDRRRLVHVPFRVDRDPLGDSPLVAIRAALLALAEVYRFSSAYYTTATVPPYAVTHPNRLTSTQAQQFADQWFTARAERRPAILSGGIAIETYDGVSAADALLLEALDHLDAVVSRVMQIPPSLLNTTAQSSLTYATTQGELSRWLIIGLYPLFLSRLEAAFTELLPRGQFAVFDTSKLTAPWVDVNVDAAATPPPVPLPPATPTSTPVLANPTNGVAANA